jgi:predicted lipoprotein with Yx(FWY)xxD motif
MHEPRHRNHHHTGAARPGARLGTLVVLTATAAVAAIGFLAAGSIARSATHANATVSLHETSLGMVLVNSRNHTLYLFAKDRNGKSACSASCAKFWPPLLDKGTPTAGTGVKASLLGTTRRSNGSMQVTYNKHPLYTFALDKSAGQTNGEGNLAFGARWYSVSAKGNAVMRPSSGSTAATTTMMTTGTTTCAYPPCP